MITIKINGKKHNIKKYSELNLSEYIQLLELISKKENFNIFDYIAFCSGYKFEELMLQKVTNLTLLQKTLGELRIIKGDAKEKVFAIEDLPMRKMFAYDGYIFSLDKVKMKSKLGYRAVIEQYMQSNPTLIELYTFTLATVLNEKHNNDFDYDSILKVQEDLQEYKAYDVLKCGSVFFSNLTTGGKSVLSYLKALKSMLIKTRG